MIAEANREIRWAQRVANKERSERRAVKRPYIYLDELIGHLEALHIKGLSNVPRSFMPRLEVVSKLLPPEIDAPSQWRRHSKGC